VGSIFEITDRKAKPFLRWAGGKKWFAKHLPQFIPRKFNNFHEIFLGSASTYFNIPDHFYSQAYLSDINDDLINTFTQVKEKSPDVIKILKGFKNEEDYYYKIRNLHEHSDPIFRAARFIYLNKTSYNGIYRVNSTGKFNVPYGYRRNVDFIDEKNLFAVSSKLKNAHLSVSDFDNALDSVKKDDFVFIDPPYTVAHENNGFIEYNKNLFSLDDQIRLSKAIERLVSKGAFYLLTNAKHSKILEIYSNLDKPKILKRHSNIGGNGAKREVINEYIFTNV